MRSSKTVDPRRPPTVPLLLFNCDRLAAAHQRLARRADNHAELYHHTRFGVW